MRRVLSGFLVTAAIASGIGASVERTASAQGQSGRPEVTPPVHHDTSRPLRDIPPRQDRGERREFDVGRIPPHPGSPDQAVQSSAAVSLPLAAGLGFEGVGDGAYGFNVQYAPPDINGAVGATQYVQWVNTYFAVFNKATGAREYGPAAGNTIWAGFGGGCENNNDGDPIVQYDKAAGRWIMTQFSVSTTPYLQCVAVSDSSDATGTWHRYAYSYTQFPDYPKLAVWPDGYYISFNMFNGNTFAGARVCAYNRAAMLAGASANQVCFQLGTSYGGLLPSDLDGLTPPPAGTPNFFLSAGSNALLLWKFAVNWSGAGTGTLTGPTSIPVAGFTQARCGVFGSMTCVPQLGTSQKLDTLGDRLMYRLAYRNFGSYQSLVVNHSVNVGSSVGVRWYEIRQPSATPVVYQQATYAPDANYRWMGSAAMDKLGNMVIGYSVSSGSMNPAIRFAGRLVSDAPNTLSAETSIIDGTGSQTLNLARWGDYSSMSVDPVDDCTFWYTNEYEQTNGTWNWHTRISSFSYPSCTSATSDDFSIAATPASQTVVQGSGTSYAVNVTASGNFSGDVALSLSALPAGATGTFTPASITGGSGGSTLNITTAASTPSGTYPLTITGTSGSLTHTANVTLVVNATSPTGGDFTIAASPGSRNIKAGTATSYTVTTTALNGFTGDLALSVTGAPTGTTASLSPSTVTAGGSSTLNVITTAGTPKGTFALTITGTSGSLVHAATVSLRVR
jgi:hypothetical protein